MKPTELTTTDGKPLGKAWKRTIQKLVDLGYLRHEYTDSVLAIRNQTARNPYSGVQVMLCDIAMDLANWIVKPNPIQKPITRSDWNNARSIFNCVWPDEYYKLID